MVGHVWLAGMMGTGKTTVGALVAERLQRPLLDTDAIVMEATGRTIPELFSESEWRFRSHERSAISVAAAHDASVIATGGGAVLDAPNLVVMRSTGTVVLLTADTSEILSRLRGDAAERPLATSPERIEMLQRERSDAYLTAADHVIDTTGKGPDTVASEVLACVGT